MTDNFEREKSLFNEALELPSPEARRGFLKDACGPDDGLRDRIEALIDAFESATAFIPTHERETPGPSVGTTATTEQPGDVIGPYKLLAAIGEGGFGTVWMADQSTPVRRRVAMKIIKPGLDSREVIARFAQERQALAIMDHANIARILDAGATKSGRPFFVMELVRGVKITDYCDEQGLDIAERVRLFLQVCHAVHHAHQKGVIHRDIKPSNVLVTVNDGEAVVKVIDFGVAKATQGSLTDATVFTQFFQMIGTPAYMSPEQAEMTSLDIDTRSDIYSLGVLLYELITGDTPIDAATLARAGLDEIRRVIREVTPPRPSTWMRALSAEKLTTAAKRRRTAGAKLFTLLRGDLDWIVMMCLEKDRKRRYDSANALALDLARYLDHGIVTARPPTATYLMGRIVRRHRLAFAAALAVLVTLAAGVTTTLWMAIRAAEERDRAQKAEGTAEQRRKDAVMEKQRAIEQTEVKDSVLSFLVNDLLLQADSREQQKLAETANPKLTVSEALHRASARMGDRFSGRPAEEAAIRSAMGMAFLGIGEPSEALPHLERSRTLTGDLHGESAKETLLEMARLMEARNAAAQFKEAVTLGEEILKLATTPEEPDSDFVLAIKTHLAQALSNGGDLKRGLTLQEEVVKAHAARGGEKSEEAMRAELSLAQAYAMNSRHREAIPAYEAVLKWQREHPRPDDMELAATLSGLGASHGFQDEPGKARPLYEEALRIMKGARGEDHEQTLRVMEGLARTYEQLGHREKHLDAVRTIARGMGKSLGGDHPLTLRAEARRAAALFDSGDMDEGLALLQKTVERQEATLGAGHQDTLGSQSLLGRLYWSSDRIDEAIQVFKDAREHSLNSLGAPHSTTQNITLNLGVNYIDRDRVEEGIALIAEILDAQNAAGGSADPAVLSLIRTHVDSHEQRKRYDRAVALQRLLVETLKREATIDPLETATEVARLGGDLLKLNRFDEARAELQQALETFAAKAPDNWRRWVTMTMLGTALTGLGEFEKAEPLLIEANGHLQPATGVNPTYKRIALQGLAALYSAWDAAKPNTGKAEKAIEWQDKLKDFQ